MHTSQAVEEHLSLLMARAQQGDEDAYVTLLKAVVPRIRRLISSQRGFLPTADVDDLVQEVLLSLHSVRATYEPTRPFAPWLAAIVRHRLADAGRQYVRHGQREVAGDNLDVTFAAAATNTPTTEFGDAEALTHAIQALPPGQRQAIELLKLRELSLKEAAERTGMTIGALKLATFRAMASLRRTLRRTS